MPLTRKGAFVLSAIAIIILAIIGIAFFATFSDKGGSTLNNILDDWFSSVKAPEIGKPDIVVYGECPGATIKACGNVWCREGELKIIVSNEGEGSIAKNLTFIICANKAGYASIKQEVSGLKISQEKAFQFPASGDYELIADCYDQVVELDEINNVVDIDCPSQYLVNCYEETSASLQASDICPFYCNKKRASTTGGDMTCFGVNAEKYPDKLINLTDCGKCPSDEDFEGGCYCPAYCATPNWNKQTAPGTNCGNARVPEMGYVKGFYNSCADAMLCSCDKQCDPEIKGRVGYVPRGASCGGVVSDGTPVNTMQVLQDCTSTCTADKSGRGCFCPIECDKDFALPGETCGGTKA